MYVYGPGLDEPIMMLDVIGQSRYFYTCDGLGSVTALSNMNGQIVERYAYDAFGKTQILAPNYELRTTSLYGNPILFTGRRLDAESGFYDYRFRMYSPDLGRFLQPDPLGYIDGMNLYAYVNNNPLNWIDPWGLCKTNEPTRLIGPDVAKVARDFYNDRLYDDSGWLPYNDEWMSADTWFHYNRGRYKYAGKEYCATQVNYIGVGMRAAHVGLPRGMLHIYVVGHNRKHNRNWATRGEHFWASWGYDYYLRNYEPDDRNTGMHKRKHYGRKK